MVTQLQHFEMARRRIAEFNSMFMDLVNHPTNPLTKSDLAALIAKRPNTYGRFAGFMDKLPDLTSAGDSCQPRYWV